MTKIERGRWSLEFEVLGGHTHVVVRVGQPGSRAKAGDLTFRNEEAEEMIAAFTALADLESAIAQDGLAQVSKLNGSYRALVERRDEDGIGVSNGDTVLDAIGSAASKFHGRHVEPEPPIPPKLTTSRQPSSPRKPTLASDPQTRWFIQHCETERRKPVYNMRSLSFDAVVQSIVTAHEADRLPYPTMMSSDHAVLAVWKIDEWSVSTLFSEGEPLWEGCRRRRFLMIRGGSHSEVHWFSPAEAMDAFMALSAGQTVFSPM